MDELASKITPYVIEYDDEHAALIREYSDGLLVSAKIRGDIPGTKAGASLMGSVNEIICRVELDDDTVYALTRTNLENTEALAAIADDLKYWDTQVAASADSAYYPYHAGAIRYYKEIGVWTDELESWNDALLAQYGCER
jgi:hypothetical protein